MSESNILKASSGLVHGLGTQHHGVLTQKARGNCIDECSLKSALFQCVSHSQLNIQERLEQFVNILETSHLQMLGLSLSETICRIGGFDF